MRLHLNFIKTETLDNLQSYSSFGIMTGMTSEFNEDGSRRIPSDISNSNRLSPVVPSEGIKQNGIDYVKESCFSEPTAIITEEEKVEVPGGLEPPKYNPRSQLPGAKQWIAAAGIGTASFWGINAFAEVGGGVLGYFNPLTGLDPKVAFGLWMASYYPEIKGVLRAAESAWKSREEIGLSPSPFADAGYYIAERRTNKQWIHRAATYMGFASTELVSEVLWFGQYLAMKKMPDFAPEFYTPNLEYAFCIGANLAAAGYMYGQAYLTEGALKLRRRIINATEDNPGRTGLIQRIKTKIGFK